MSDQSSKLTRLGKAGFRLSSKMGLAASAWALSLVAIFVPFLGTVLIWIALVMAIIHALLGGILLPLLTLFTCIIDRWYFSLPMGMLSLLVTLILMAGVLLAVKFSVQSWFKS